MGKLPYGVPNRHVQASKGGDSDVMKFYCTTNATTYGKKFASFEPRPGRHTGTGYLSNFRPGVYYNSHLDELDNPTMGRLVANNYHSVTENSFQPYRGPSGTEALPNSTKQVGSGFVQQKPITTPYEHDVWSVCIDTRVASAPADIMPRHKPHLHKIQPRDPVELENGGYGPAYMRSETQEKFLGTPTARGDVSRRSVGDKEGSGFTHAYNIEPITFHPDYAHQGNIPGYFTDRPTGISIMRTDFRPSEFPRGDEPLPRLANRSVRDTGFTSGTKAKPVFVNRVMADAYDKAADIPDARLDRTRKQDPTEYMNMIHPDNHSSVSKGIFLGQQLPSKSESDRLARTSVGTKELTGYSENNDRFIQTADNPARFITHYGTKFMDRTPKALDREGHTWGGIQPQKPDGFTKSTKVDRFAPDYDTTATLRRLEPYVSRSIKARDVFYDDHTHDSKLYRSHTMIAANH